MESVVYIGICDMEWYIGNKVNTENNNAGVSDNEGYSTNT
jgi:hypothetical protein